MKDSVPAVAAPDLPVPDLLVEKLALDELPAVQAAAVRERLGEDAQARVDAIAASNAEVLEALPPSLVAAQVQEAVKRAPRISTPARSRWTPWLATAAVAAGALLLWNFVGRDGAADPSEAPSTIARVEQPAADAGSGDGDTIRFKGGTKLWVSRFADGEAQRLATGAKVAAGQTLQVEYAAGDAVQGVIVSIDGAGKAWLHFPDTVAGDPSLRGRTSLAHGYELDDAPGFERFFFVTTQSTALSVAKVLEAAEALARSEHAHEGDLQLPAGLQQQSLLLNK